MSPIKYPRSGFRTTCRINPDGRLTIPQIVMTELDLQARQRFDLHYTKSPVIMQLCPGSNGYILRHLNAGNNPHGGFFTLRGFTNDILKASVILPQHELVPINVSGWEGFVFMLSEPDWKQEEFSLSSVRRINTEIVGVYEILDSKGNIIRIGQGGIRSRLNAHLKNEALAKKAKNFRYAMVEPVEDTEFVERVLLARYLQENEGELPEFNAIQA